MSFLATALDDLMRERDWSQTETATRSGIAQSNISRYLRGVIPEPEHFEKLCSPFGPDAALLVAAWSRDMTPVALRKLLPTPAHANAIAEASRADGDLIHFSPRVRKLTKEVAAACEADPDVFAAVQSTMALVGKRRK